MRIFKFLAMTLFFSCLAVALSAGAAGQLQAKNPGVDVSAIDRSVDPCVDFYQFSCGSWLKNNPIPADQAAWGRFNELAERNRAILHDILENAAKAPNRSANEQKTGDFYATCIDEEGINKKGATVLKPYFDRIDAVKSKADLPGLISYLHEQGINALFGFESGADFKNAGYVIAIANQGGMSLPDRDFYFKTDDKSVKLRTAFVEHVGNMFKLLGDSPEKATAEANAVMSMETALAKGALNREQQRDPAAIYHKMSKAEWQALTPSFSVSKYLADIGEGNVDSLNVAVPDFFKGLETELGQASLDDIKTYLRWRLVSSQSLALPTVFSAESFNFYGKTMRGAKEQQARWKRCVAATDGDLGEALGQVYVAKAYPPEAKARTLAMVHQIEEAMRDDLNSLTWMTDATKKQALVKLAAVSNKIGYPDKWRDYSSLKIVRGEALGNSLRANAFGVHYELSKIGKPLDKSEWQMTPPTVNAYYEPTENDINFPAGILQPPFYDFKADDGSNLGGVGAVIGHELTHGFDDEGRQFDAQGNLHNWWTEQDTKAFDERVKCLVDEYNGFVAVDDVHLNGKLTLGENTADNGGLRLADMVLLESLKGKTPQNIDGYTPEQRLFLGWGQIWCQNLTDQIARLQALTNEHSLGRFRVNGVVQNMPEFQRAWSCKAGQPMVSKNACRVW